MAKKPSKKEPIEAQVPDEDVDQQEAEDPLAPELMLGVLEAVLFAAEEPLNEKAIALTIPGLLEARVNGLVEELEEHYLRYSRGLTVQRVAGGWRLATRAEYADYVRNHLRGKLRNRLSRAALETVSIIAYRQPLSRSEIEQMRGVDCSPVLRNLLERNLIRITGRAEVPGRPLLYGTTDSFLEYFGLESITSLPKAEEILGDPDEEAAGNEMPVQRGPFLGSDSGVELETYRFVAQADSTETAPTQPKEAGTEPGEEVEKDSIWDADLPDEEEGQGGGSPV
ncbi:SMC-Scp complex subunit ScpB [bacterium]|nr:SMC-Scp complex subunit ScpB [bacterium]